MEKNWSYKITDPNHPKYGATLWSGRYCAVTGIVIRYIYNPMQGKNNIYILANLRGPGTPDYQGYWNMPCGFLERNESGEEGVAREIFEECGLEILPGEFDLYGVETDPVKSNNGNVTIRYISIDEVSDLPELKYTNINGEDGEVESVKWINIRDIKNYKWAFGHKELIDKAISTCFTDPEYIGIHAESVLDGE